MAREARIRVLLAQVGLDFHNRASRVLATMLRDAGMEVVYLGQYQTPEKVAQAAVQEDVDVVGLSCYVGQHLHYAPLVKEALKRKGKGGVLLLVGGVIPKADIAKLKGVGVDEVFRSGSAFADIVNYIREKARPLPTRNQPP